MGSEMCIRDRFSYHKKFSPEAQQAEIDRDCRSGALGCVECKKLCASHISQFLAPILERRHELAAKPEMVQEILLDGEARARAVARETMQEVRETMKLG